MEKEPSATELQQFMDLVDLDKSGTVSFSEFLTAITKWLGEDREHAKEDKKRKFVESERHTVHKKIKGFFQQFQQSQQFDNIRKRMHNLGAVDDVMDLDEDLHDQSSIDKIAFLTAFRSSLEADKESIILTLKAGHIDHLLPAVSKLHELLRILEIFHTPVQRRSIAEDVLRIFSLVLEQGFVEPLVKCLYLQHIELQLLALSSLRLIAPGPCIASTPHDHILHPDKMLFKRIIYTQNPFAMIVSLISGPNPRLCEEALAFVATFAQHHPECRDAVLEHGALPPILTMASLAQRNAQLHSPTLSPNPSHPPPVLSSYAMNANEELAKVVRAMVVLLGVSQPVTKLPPWALISTALPVVGSLLFSNDPDILLPILAAASFMFPGIPETPVCRRLVELLTSHPSPRVKKAALKTLESIFKYDRQQTDILIGQCGAMPVLHSLLTQDDVALRSAACSALGFLAQHQPDFLVKSSTIPLLLERIHTDEHTRAQLVHTLAQFANGRQPQVEHLIGKDAIKSLCRAFAYFKSYDEVLVVEYKYAEAMYSFKLVDDILTILETILNTGETIANTSTGGINTYALNFDLEVNRHLILLRELLYCVDKIRSFLATIKDGLEHYGKVVDAWREKGVNKPANHTEERTKYILLIVLKAHKANAETNKNKEEAQTSQMVVDMIHQIGKEFFGTPIPQEKILLKCNHNNDIRIVSVDSDTSFPLLKNLIEDKYQITRATMSYVDEENDNITIDSKESLQKAFAKHKSDGTRALKITIGIMPPIRRKLSTPGTLHANLTSPSLSPSSYPKTALTPLLTPLDMDAMSMDVQNLESIKAQERKDLLESLAKTSRFGPQELETMMKNWASQAPSGFLTRQQFEAGLVGIGVQDPLVIQSYWRAFDAQNENKINFRQFVTSLGILKRGALEEKLRFAFKAFDRDNSGFIEKPELTEMIRAGLTAQNRAMSHQELHMVVEECFRLMDENKDLKLSFEEFAKAIMLQPTLLSLFVPSIPGLQL
eukprot:Phypoly_transcript_01741.p1 GENE.Phypoly_transcript_01741~~Phypoly_transcript_01741.p1  ORF type:complete len:1057 (+),score=244.85 Phypoly_transcript_01741:163-3171(+)